MKTSILFLDYNRFMDMNEDVESLKLVSDSSKFLPALLNVAKKNKKLKRIAKREYVAANPEEWAENGISFDSYIFVDGKICINREGIETNSGSNWIVSRVDLEEDHDYSKREDMTKSLNPARILILSTTPIDQKDIDEVFPENVSAAMKESFMWKRSIDSGEHRIEIKSRTVDWTDGNVKISYHPLKKFRGHSLIVNYEMSIGQKVEMTWDKLQTLDEYKELMKEIPLEMVSNSKMIKNGTYAFSIPSKYIFDKNQTFISEGEPYLQKGYALYSRGYIRWIQLYDVVGNQAGVAGSFDPSTEKGWGEGLREISRIWKERIKKMKKEDRDFEIFLTEEDRKNARGHILTKELGIG